MGDKLSIEFFWLDSVLGDDFPEAEYNALLEQIAGRTPYNLLSWLRGAEQGMPATQRISILLGYRSGELVLCLPLLVSSERPLKMPVTVVRHLGYPLTDRIALAVRGDIPGLLDMALAEIRKKIRFSYMQLSEITRDCARDSGLDQWHKQFWFSESRISCSVPVHEITESDRLEPSGNIRYKLRRARKRADQISATVSHITPDRETVCNLIETIAAVEDASWKGDDGVGVFSGEMRMRWMKTALTGLAVEGRVRVVSMEHEGRCISYRLGLLDQGRIYDYNLAFLPEYASLGSGRLLLDEWIKWGLDEDWRWVDASRVRLEDSSHQLHERCSYFEEHRRWTFYNSNLSGLLLGLAYKAWLFIKPRMKAYRNGRRAASKAAGN